jgi:hypothetical protein
MIASVRKPHIRKEEGAWFVRWIDRDTFLNHFLIFTFFVDAANFAKAMHRGELHGRGKP